jgi:glutamate N-acetyltransferase/amino-acid N-acetyltransferase
VARSALTGNAETIHAIEGVRFGVTNVGIRKKDRNDLVVMTLHKAASVVGVFTQNNFSAAPVQICKQRLSEGWANHSDGNQYRGSECGNWNERRSGRGKNLQCAR